MNTVLWLCAQTFVMQYSLIINYKFFHQYYKCLPYAMKAGGGVIIPCRPAYSTAPTLGCILIEERIAIN